MTIRVFLVLISLLLPLSGLAVAQDETFEATIYQTVNIRSGPDTRYEIVGQVRAGDTVRATGRANETGLWVRVELDDETVGWVPSYLLILDGELLGLPVVDATAPDGSDADLGSEIVTVTAYGTVNVRSGPSIVDEIIGQLDAGDTARALARSNERNDWLYIENTTLAGWVAYFTVDVRGDVRTLAVRVPDVATHELVHPRELITTLFNVRLRVEPSLEADEVGVLDFDTEVTAFARGEDPDWIYVGSVDMRGWAVAELFDITQEHLDALPLYDEDAIYELLTDDTDDEPRLEATATFDDEAPVSEPVLLPTAEVTATSDD